MTSTLRTILLALYATILFAFSDVSRSTTSVTAFPLRTPLPVSQIPSSYSDLKNMSIPRSSQPSASPDVVISRGSSHSRVSPNNQGTDSLSRLTDSYGDAKNNAKLLGVCIASSITQIHSAYIVLEELAAQSASVRPNDPDFQQQSISQLTALNGNILDIQGILKALAADKGQAFYDSSNQLEVLLKDITNLSKATLKNIDDMVANVPILGPTLEPSK